MSEVSLNVEQKLYVIPCGRGYSCLGFDVLFNEVTELAQRLGRPLPSKDERGTLSLYARRNELLKEYAVSPHSNTTWFDPETPAGVRDVLNRYVGTDTRLRWFYGDPKTGRSWHDECDMIGTIGRSTGTLKIPLGIANSRSIGGGALLTTNIVRIQRVSDGAVLYSHPQFHTGKMTISWGQRSKHPDIPWKVSVDGKIHARFKTKQKAKHWIAFMKGDRFCT